MIYSLILEYLDQENEKVLNYDLDTSYLDITFSDMANQSPVAMETKKLTIGTTDGAFHLIDLWNELSQINVSAIKKVILKQNNTEYTFEDPIENIFYLVNFNGPGDMISICYNKAKNPVENISNNQEPLIEEEVI